jgi:hypothetical protein
MTELQTSEASHRGGSGTPPLAEGRSVAEQLGREIRFPNPPLPAGELTLTAPTSPQRGEMEDSSPTGITTPKVSYRVDVVVAPSPPKVVVCSRRRRAPRILLSFATLLLALNLGFGLLLDHGPPHLRDPEYGLRLNALRARLKEHAGRPLVAVIGSSRTAMGVRPDVVESGEGPLLFNLSSAGAGPVTQLMILRRLQHDGITPAAVVLEYWPPFFRGDSAYREDSRLNPSRLRPEDERTVDEFFADPAETKRRMADSRWLPFHTHRKPLMDRFAPGWLPHTERGDAMFAQLDGWGWLAGRESTTAAERDKGWPHVFGYYWPLFRFYSVDANQDRALRACLTHCRERGIPVTLAYLPESARFQTLKSAESVALADAHLAAVRRDTGVSLLDAREWIADDECLPDGFHLTRSAAATFTRRFAAELPTLVNPCRK